MMETYYVGGYKWVLPTKKGDLAKAYPRLLTASSCINVSPLELWCWEDYSVAEVGVEEDFLQLQLDREKVDAIRTYVTEQAALWRVNRYEFFADVKSAREYRAKFFAHLPRLELLRLDFSETERESYLHEFPRDPEQYDAGMASLLAGGRPAAAEGEVMGFDLIGVEPDGSFHSFHCHYLEQDMTERFGVVVNEFGLMDDPGDQAGVIVDFANDPDTGLEPVPWFMVRVSVVPA
jgi:hypothetical protein